MQKIERTWDGTPTVFEDKIEIDCMLCNTLVGFGTIIIDEEFINEMKLIASEVKDDKGLISLLTRINNSIKDYFSSLETNEKTREVTYSQNNVIDEEGFIVGTRISSLKGKNISKCSEKSVAAYIILDELYDLGALSRKPALILSKLCTTESPVAGPHAFIMLNSEKSNASDKHILFDPENPTLAEDKEGNQYSFVGLYSVNDAQYEDFLNGSECTPASLYEIMYGYHEVSPKRTYGNKEKTKSL